MNNITLNTFNKLMLQLERLTGESMLLNEFEQAYMDLPDYDRSLRILVSDLAAQIDQLTMDGIK